MNKKKILVAALVVVALGAALAWLARRPAPASTPANATAPAAAPATPAAIELSHAEVITLAPGSVARTIPLTGTLKATNQTLVRARVAGDIVELLVREGMPVKAGQRLARIDPTDYEARVREREAQHRSAESQLEQARRTRDNNRALLDRNFISQNAYDNAQSGYEVAVANRDAAIAQLAVARKALADTVVLASMSGIVAERFVQVGEKVSPDNRLLSIVDLSRMEIEAPVPASDIGGVRVGQSVQLAVEGVEGAVTGEIVRISPATSTGTRSVPVYIGLDNRDPRVRAGLFAQGMLAVARRDGVIVVPAAALRDAGGRSFVYRIADGRLEERTVRTGLRDDSARAANGSVGVVEVIDGLAAGDAIVGLNLGTLRAGSPVRIAGRDGGAAAPAAR